MNGRMISGSDHISVRGVGCRRRFGSMNFTLPHPVFLCGRDLQSFPPRRQIASDPTSPPLITHRHNKHRLPHHQPVSLLTASPEIEWKGACNVRHDMRMILRRNDFHNESEKRKAAFSCSHAFRMPAAVALLPLHSHQVKHKTWYTMHLASAGTADWNTGKAMEKGSRAATAGIKCLPF